MDLEIFRLKFYTFPTWEGDEVQISDCSKDLPTTLTNSHFIMSTSAQWGIEGGRLNMTTLRGVTSNMTTFIVILQTAA